MQPNLPLESYSRTFIIDTNGGRQACLLVKRHGLRAHCSNTSLLSIHWALIGLKEVLIEVRVGCTLEVLKDVSSVDIQSSGFDR